MGNFPTSLFPGRRVAGKPTLPAPGICPGPGRFVPQPAPAATVTVDVPDGDLTSFRQVAERFHLTRKWQDAVGAYEDRRCWRFAFGGVAPDRIVRVEVWDGKQFSEVKGDNLALVAAAIEAEAEKKLEFFEVGSGVLKGARALRLKAGVLDSWLLDGQGVKPILQAVNGIVGINGVIGGGKDIIPINAIFHPATGLDDPALTTEAGQALRDAELIFGVDVMSGREFLVFGRALLEGIIRTRQGRPTAAMRIGVDQETDDLEKLVAAVEFVKGSHDYVGGGQGEAA